MNIGTTLGLIKDVVALGGRIQNVELTQKLMELQQQLFDMIDELRKLRSENEDLQGRLDHAAQMSFHAPFWYAAGDEIPHCPTCWESKRVAIHLLGPADTSSGPRYDCKACGAYFIHPRRPEGPRSIDLFRG